MSASTLPEPLERIRKLLALVAEEIRPCKRCGEQIAFVRHRSGALAPYTIEGVNHFINCPAADQFKRNASAAPSAPKGEPTDVRKAH